MRATSSITFTLAAVMVSVLAAMPANATCKRFGFTVNDYGKEGPTNDAKNLLDKHIADWAAKNGVTEYQTGKKSVSCELFLDVILFDEHTCTATANVCWGPSLKKSDGEQASADDGAGGVPAPVSKAEALGIEPQSQQVAAEAAPGDTAATEAAATESAPTDTATAEVDQEDAPPVPLTNAAADETPSAQPAVSTATTHVPAAAAGAGAMVETGAIGDMKPTPPATATTAENAPATDSSDRAAAAAAAASAAAAAERAAAAAETAANAAKEAAAAAVAASAASKAGAVVPPLDHASGAKPVHNE